MLSPVARVEGATVHGDCEDQPHIAIAGKTTRRSHDRKSNLGPLHIVSARAAEGGITLGQVATDEKSNEVTAIPELLEMFEVEGALKIGLRLAFYTLPAPRGTLSRQQRPKRWENVFKATQETETSLILKDQRRRGRLL